MSLYAISEIRSKALIHRFLMIDPDFAAYALGDLEEPYARHARWIGAAQSGDLEGLALIYSGLEPLALFLMGPNPAISALLLYGIGPTDVTLLAPTPSEPILRDYFHIEHAMRMDRMRVTNESFRSHTRLDAEDITPLGEGNIQDMLNLIIQAARHDARDLRDVAFEPEMVQTGSYVGIYQDDTLIAMAGTHLEARKVSVAAVGNVVVHPGQRGKGLGKAVSSAVTSALLESGYERIVLNVRSDNLPAIRVYERLGYQKATDFIEAIGRRE